MKRGERRGGEERGGGREILEQRVSKRWGREREKDEIERKG